jgi:predicted nucleotidyltransferase
MTMKTAAEIRAILRAHADELRQRYGMTDLAVFGSVARGEAQERSDIDLLVSFVRPIGLIELSSAECYLTELLGMRVDVVPSRCVRPELRERIFAEALAV